MKTMWTVSVTVADTFQLSVYMYNVSFDICITDCLCALSVCMTRNVLNIYLLLVCAAVKRAVSLSHSIELCLNKMGFVFDYTFYQLYINSYGKKAKERIECYSMDLCYAIEIHKHWISFIYYLPLSSIRYYLLYIKYLYLYT